LVKLKLKTGGLFMEQQVQTGFEGIAYGYLFIWLIIILIMIISLWKIFEKAGKPGWAAIIPIYNLIVLLEIVEKPLWWIVLYLIPCVSLIAHILVSIELGKKFGKDTGWSIIFLVILSIIGYPMLAFGDSQYQK
jgi:hypothetical protein